MQGDEQVIEALNAGLTVELTAINLYFISSKMCKDWGLDRLAQHFYEESIEEMKHAEEVIDRILFLGGTLALFASALAAQATAGAPNRTAARA